MRWLPVPNACQVAPIEAMRWRRGSLVAWMLIAAVATIVPTPGSTAFALQEARGDDGCYYSQGGNVARCPQSDGSDYYYQRNGNSWTYTAQCMTTVAFLACLTSPQQQYVEFYGDGSMYIEAPDRNYTIALPGGAVVECGYYDAARVQHVYRGCYRQAGFGTTQAQKNRSQQYWVTHANAVNTVVNTGTGLDWVRPGRPDGTAYMNCLWANDSATDFDNDNRTGFTELVEYCAPS